MCLRIKEKCEVAKGTLLVISDVLPGGLEQLVAKSIHTLWPVVCKSVESCPHCHI